MLTHPLRILLPQLIELAHSAGQRRSPCRRPSGLSLVAVAFAILSHLIAHTCCPHLPFAMHAVALVLSLCGSGEKGERPDVQFERQGAELLEAGRASSRRLAIESDDCRSRGAAANEKGARVGGELPSEELRPRLTSSPAGSTSDARSRGHGGQCGLRTPLGPARASSLRSSLQTPPTAPVYDARAPRASRTDSFRSQGGPRLFDSAFLGAGGLLHDPSRPPRARTARHGRLPARVDLAHGQQSHHECAPRPASLARAASDFIAFVLRRLRLRLALPSPAPALPPATTTSTTVAHPAL